MADDGSPSMTPEDAALLAVFPNGLPANRRSVSPFIRSFPLETSHLESLRAHGETDRSISIRPDLISIKRRHHRLAMLLAAGTDQRQAAAVCGVHLGTIHTLQRDPLFRELLDMYSDGVTAEFRDTVMEMRELADDVIALMRDKIEAQGAELSITQLNEILKTLADRTGNGPTTHNKVSAVTLSLTGDDIERVKSAANSARPADRPLPRISEEDRRVIEGVFARVGQPVPVARPPEELGRGEGPSLRTQDAVPPANDLFADEPADGDAS
jgi:hypothetical protein